VALIKPQFEAGREVAARGKGVIRDPEVHRQVLLDVLTFAEEQQFAIWGLTRSPVLGPKGNVEFLAWLGVGSRDAPSDTWHEWVSKILQPDLGSDL